MAYKLAHEVVEQYADSYNVIHSETGGETTNSAGISLEKMMRQIQDFKNGSVTRVQGAG